MPRKKEPPPQKNKLSSYFFHQTPSQPRQNAAFASSPAAPSTIQETPTTDPAPALDHTVPDDPDSARSPPSSPLLSRSPSPTASRLVAAYDGAADRRTPGLPHSSGTSTNASKRAFSGGKPVVLNSDSDTDSLSDLDLWDKPPVTKPKTVTRAATVWNKENQKETGLPQPPKRTKDSQAFKRMVEAAKKNAQVEQDIAKAQAELDKPLQQAPPARDPRISEKMVADAVQDGNDPDKAKKLYQAMQRTNALAVDHVFHFFKHEPKVSEKPFPVESLPENQASSMFLDDFSREQAFHSGFAKLFFGPKLPKELADWMIYEVCIGSSEALGRRYLDILSTRTNQWLLQELLDVGRIEEIFINLGAEKELMTADSEVTPSYESEPARRMLPPALINVCKLLKAAASSLQIGPRRIGLLNLLLVCVDDRVQTDNLVLQALQDAIESLIYLLPSNAEMASMLGTVISQLLPRICHPTLQRNLVTALPARYPLTASIQRHLALSFLLYPTEIIHSLTSPEVLDLLHNHLQRSPAFRIQKNTDYAVLAAHFTLLDLAIGPGPLVVPFQLITSPSPSQESQESLFEPPKPTPDEVKLFNREIDALARRIRVIGNGIHVAGAITDLSRLTASDACDRLCTRLERVVRIGGRKFKDVFGRLDESEGDSEMMKKFLFRKKPIPLTKEESAPGMVGEDEVSTVKCNGEELVDGISAVDNAMNP